MKLLLSLVQIAENFSWAVGLCWMASRRAVAKSCSVPDSGSVVGESVVGGAVVGTGVGGGGGAQQV